MTTDDVLTRPSVSIKHVCELMGVSRRTVYLWMASGKVEYILTAGGSRRVFVDTLWRDPDAEEPMSKPKPEAT